MLRADSEWGVERRGPTRIRQAKLVQDYRFPDRASTSSTCLLGFLPPTEGLLLLLVLGHKHIARGEGVDS